MGPREKSDRTRLQISMIGRWPVSHLRYRFKCACSYCWLYIRKHIYRFLLLSAPAPGVASARFRTTFGSFFLNYFEQVSYTHTIPRIIRSHDPSQCQGLLTASGLDKCFIDSCLQLLHRHRCKVGSDIIFLHLVVLNQSSPNKREFFRGSNKWCFPFKHPGHMGVGTP